MMAQCWVRRRRRDCWGAWAAATGGEEGDGRGNGRDSGEPGHDQVAPTERGRRGRERGGNAAGAASVGWRGRRGCSVGGGGAGGHLERGVVSQDRLLEPLQGLAGLDPELVDQVVPSLLVGVEGVRLAVGAVEGEHLLGAQAFPERVFADEHLQLAEHLLVAALGEIAIDPVHEHGQS